MPLSNRVTGLKPSRGPFWVEFETNPPKPASSPHMYELMNEPSKGRKRYVEQKSAVLSAS